MVFKKHEDFKVSTLCEKTWRKCYNPANYYIKFENEEEFVKRLEKVLLEEKKNEQ